MTLMPMVHYETSKPHSYLNLFGGAHFYESRSLKVCNIANKTCSSCVWTTIFPWSYSSVLSKKVQPETGQKKVKWIFETKKDFITYSKLIINELVRCPTRSDNLYFANN